MQHDAVRAALARLGQHSWGREADWGALLQRCVWVFRSGLTPKACVLALHDRQPPPAAQGQQQEEQQEPAAVAAAREDGGSGGVKEQQQQAPDEQPSSEPQQPPDPQQQQPEQQQQQRQPQHAPALLTPRQQLGALKLERHLLAIDAEEAAAERLRLRPLAAVVGPLADRWAAARVAERLASM